MADLSFEDNKLIEKMTSHRSGYLLDFSNRDFQEFIQDVLGYDIYDKKYEDYGSSKGSKLRGILKNESNIQCAKLLERLLKYWADDGHDFNIEDGILYDAIDKIIKGLKSKGDAPMQKILLTQINEDNVTAAKLINLINEALQRNEPESILDRLHTLLINYMRCIAKKYNIEYTSTTLLNSIFGLYIKLLKEKGIIQSKMAMAILQYYIKVLESYHDVRNNQSLAHDNNILNKHESRFIVNSVLEFLRYLDFVESNLHNQQEEDISLPF